MPPRLIRPTGPIPCEFAVVGEGPGFFEDRTGYAFAGKTGEELNRHLDGVNLPSRDDVFCTNLYRRYRGKNYVWQAADLEEGEPLLIAELNECQPKVIIPLGRHATRWFLGDVDMDDVRSLPWLLGDHKLLPTLAPNTVVFPIVHPAAGMHNSEMAPYVVTGFQALGQYLDGELEPRRLYDDPLAGKEHYEEITTIGRLNEITHSWKPTTNVSIDTEGWPGNPWSLQFATDPGVAYLIRRTSPSVLSAFAACLRRVRPRLTFHSALHDLGMGRALGVDFDGLTFDDTMVQAYLLQIEPQGLKPLCTRLCNMKMQSYDEVLGESGQRKAIEYLTWLWDLEQADYEQRCEDEFIRLTTTPYLDKKGKLKPGRKLKIHPKLPKSPLHKATGRCLQSKDARKLWHDQVEDIQVAGYRRLGGMPESTLDYVAVEDAVRYGCRDADGTTRVRGELSPRIDALGLRPVYELELGTYPLIDRMHRIGIKPDLDHFANLSLRLETEIDSIRGRLIDATGDEAFNANSGDQVADYLFDRLMLEGMKKTSGGRYSTNDKILEALEKEHGLEYPVISDIRAYRETYKLKHTFVDRLPDFVKRWPFDGRIHAAFRTTRVVTGRLAASDPNLLAMPKHGKFARDFRRGWVPEDGHLLCEWDLSQIELRVLAHLSQDRVLLEAFRTGKDLHAGLAQRIFGGSLEDHKKGTTRLAAKAINFGIPMGMTAVGLSVELRKNGVEADEDDAQKWLDETMALYTGVPIYQDQKAAEAARNGYVRCLSGRIRYIGGIRSREERIREEAKRFSFSTPIQEGAQWLMKMAEKSVYEDILVPYWRQGRWVEPLIQVHDALTLECEADYDLAYDLNAKMTAVMTRAPKGFSVPIETSGDYGYNWSDMEAF